MFQQGIAGSLELFFWAWVRFQKSSAKSPATGARVPAGRSGGLRLPLDERVLEDTDTLLVFGLDHLVTEQEASPEEIEAVREFLQREGTCLSSVRTTTSASPTDLKQRADGVRPPRRRPRAPPAALRKYTRSLMKGLGIPVENRYGLRPARGPRARNEIAPLDDRADLDKRGWLEGVTTFNFHMHLPHYAVTDEERQSVHVLARQPIDLSRPHPFTAGGQHGVQCVRLDAAERQPRGRRADGGLDDLQHAVRRRREPGALLEEPRHREMSAAREHT